MSETSRDVWANKGEPKYCRICEAQIFGNDDVCGACSRGLNTGPLQPDQVQETTFFNPAAIGIILLCPCAFCGLFGAIVADTPQEGVPGWRIFYGSVALMVIFAFLAIRFQRKR